MELNLLLGGEAGMGLASIENGLAAVLSRLNYHFFATKNYMSRIRGGHNFHMFRIADHGVQALSGKPWDMIIALDEQTERIHGGGLASNGIFISREKTKQLEKIASDQFKDITAGNPIIVGVILSVLGAMPEQDEHLERLKAGARLAREWGMAGKFTIIPKASPEHYKFDGNQALALGAILGGCQFMASYPMTPASSIMMYMARASMDLPVHFEQAEDEISAINMALGASYAGIRSMVATSGGGFALMQEAVSLAGMTETPIVIVEAQRPGPSTGLPTRTEQGDLFFVLHSGQGEFPRAIFAPGSVDEALRIARTSFELSDQYQSPVFIMTDQYLADSIQIVEERITTEIHNREYKEYGPDYRRYALTETGISPLTYPGLGGALVKVDSDEHDEEGKITEDLDLRTRMVEKRLKKLDGIRSEALEPNFYGEKNAPAFLICWGSNKLTVKEAVAKCLQEGISVGALHFPQVYPLRRDVINRYDLGGRKLIGIENNATGQFCQLLGREIGLHVHYGILKYDGTPFTVEELYESIAGYIAGGKK